MPPPPPPKRIKRPAKVLDEDDYADALSHIIARDFFPGLLETQSKQDYLDALDSRDFEWIADAGRKLNEVVTPGPNGRRGTSMTPSPGLFGQGGKTPMAWQGDTPTSVVSAVSITPSMKPEAAEIDTNMSLGAFQEKYTSEDNESFYKLLDKQNLKRAEKHAWMWAGNKIPSARQIAHRKRERLIANNEASGEEANGRELATIEYKDERQAMPDTWVSRPDNNFMFPPGSIEDTHQTVAQRAEEISLAPPKTVLYDNTRLPSLNITNTDEPVIPSSPSLSAVRDAIAGRPRHTASESSLSGCATPRVNGYAFVDSEPDPGPSTSSRILGTGDSIPNPFKLRESSKREALHHRMVDKVLKGKRAVGKREGQLKTPVPKFASSPKIAMGGMTPAAQRLIGEVTRSGVTPKGLWEGKTQRRSGLREGWTPRVVGMNGEG